LVSCQAITPNFEFSKQEIEEAVKNNRLLSMEIEFSLRCNFRCQYCYVPDKSVFDNELNPEEIQTAILQAKELGAKKIIVLGGEPMAYPHILRMLRFIRGEGLGVEMFTNGFQITPEIASQLFSLGVDVVLKMNSLNENIQDALAGKKGAYKVIQEAFRNLKQAGYPVKDKRLGISTIICEQNFDELINMWEWLRKQNIEPYFEIMTPQGKARSNEWLHVELNKLKDLFFKIAEIDKNKYGITWDPQPPLMGIKCLRHQFSCLLNSQGYVLPCVGVNIPLGNIRQKSLKEIINESEVMGELRNYRTNIKGPCRECGKLENCYGCRGAAYQLTGDYLASDPLCWENTERQNDIVHLPMAADTLIPQKGPMRVIDNLVKVAERSAEFNITISNDMVFVCEDGSLDESVYLEMVAQATAGLTGFKSLGITNQVIDGFLLGGKKFEIFNKAHIGDTLTISIYKYARFGDFGIIKGTISRGDDIIAEGEIKIWQNKGSS
jgi:radical SAM protein with 4Fe4S-binding SPASM domain